jgi:hypothetical protein
MAYSDQFSIADDFIAHLDGVMDGIGDPFIQNRYLGFVVLSAVTVFELSIKEIFCTFATKKHAVLGNMARVKFEQINGRIKLNNLRTEFIRPFGDKYLLKFNKKLDGAELTSLRAGRGSILSSYGNIIQWRHDFVHQGVGPRTTNYTEIKAAYGRAKEVVHCLNAAMAR